ncbi:Signal recognition particle subunit SRP72 [Trichinella sp. T9]|nr:Signal recognition particle subunit SRP72 [Trichinella sp. T9]
MNQRKRKRCPGQRKTTAENDFGSWEAGHQLAGATNEMPQHLPATWSMLGRGTLLLLTPAQEIQQKNMKKKKRPTNHFPPDENTSIQSHQISTIHFNIDQQLDQQVKKMYPTNMLINSFIISSLISLIFEESYCLYRLNMLEEAASMLNSSSQMNIVSKELLAQILYRLEKPEESYKLYKEVLRNSSDGYDDERMANINAVISELQYQNPSKPLELEINPDSYEHVYNESCRLIALNEYEKAKEQLIVAENLCRNSLTEQDYTEDEIDEEISIIRVQLAYCHQMLGEMAKAGNILNEIIKKKNVSMVVQAVASNNLVCLKKDMNVFELRKRMKFCTTSQLDRQLNNRQKLGICLNGTLVSLQTNQFDAVTKSIEMLNKTYGREDLAIFCEMALMSAKGNAGQAEKKLEEIFASKSAGECSLALRLAQAQIFINQEKYEKAFDLLTSLAENTLRPAILSVLLPLCHMVNNKRTVKFLESTAKQLSDMKCDKKTLVGFLQECASFYTKNNDVKTALIYLKWLHDVQPDDLNALVNLINAYMLIDERKAEELSRTLPDFDEFVRDLNVNALENTNWLALGSKYAVKRATRTETPKPGTASNALIIGGKTRKRRRKVKLPKHFDPNVPPDPERWLPKYERSGYRKKKDKRAKDRDIGRGTQGMIGDDVETTNLETHVSPKQATAPQAIGPRQMHPAPQKPKKKKRPNNKW